MNHFGNEKHRTTVICVMLSTIVLVPWTVGVWGQESAGSSPAAENGKTVYNSAGCRRCHGLSAEGGTEGPPLVPDPKPLREFMQYVRSPQGEMPAFSPADLADSDLEDIYAYLKTLTN
jgi:mono/diheme cytochrome c family protein